MSGQHSSGSSGRSSMDQTRLEQFEALRPDEDDHVPIDCLGGTEIPRRFPQSNTDKWISMTLMKGLRLTDQKETLSPWTDGYLMVGSDSGLGRDESTGLCRTSDRHISRRTRDSLLPKPPSYWKFAILVTIINPPVGLIALFLCYLTKKDVDRGHLLHAKRRSKQTIVVMMVAFATSVVAVVLFVVILTAMNEYPFRLEPTVTHRRKPNKHGFHLDYVPPPPPEQLAKKRRPVNKPPRFVQRPRKPVEDVLGDLARKWAGVNASSFDFAHHDEFIGILNTLDNSTTHSPH